MYKAWKKRFLNYLFMEIIFVVEMKIAKKNLKSKIEGKKRGEGYQVYSSVCSVSLEGINFLL